YPHCQIELVDDYNIFSPQGYIASGYLQLVKHHMFPILTYQQAKSDPVIGLLSTLAKLPLGQTAAIQFVMRSAKKSWRSYGVRVASEMQQGKKLKTAMNASGANPVLSAIGKPADWLGNSKKPDVVPEAYRLSPMEEQQIKSIQEKSSKAGLDVNIRFISCAPNEIAAKEILRQIANTYSHYANYEYANSFKATLKGSGRQLIRSFIYRQFDEKLSFVLNTEELTSLWHLPTEGTEVPRLHWLQARLLPPPLAMPTEGLLLGENLYRGQQTLVKLKDADRRRHMYIVGMTGVGKSYLMANLAIQDIRNGKGVCVIDPHGSLIDDIMPYIPKDRLDDVIIFDPSDVERPLGLNMLEAGTPQEMDFATQEMINIFYKLLPDPAMAGPMFEHYMRNALLALMADQDDPGTLVELARIFTDESYRKKKLTYVKDILVKDFWEREYTASQKGSTGADMLSYVISKTGRFVENDMMRNIIGQPRSGFNFREVMDQKKILLMNLSKGKMGETNSNLLGLIAVSKLQMAALSRADMPEDQRHDFYLYIDEFQNFITDSISTILAEARKYKLNLIMGHQYIAQLTQHGGDTKVRDAVFGNVGTLVSFRIGVDDSELIAKQLAPQVSEYDLLNIERYNAYTRLLIDNTASETFNMHCFPLPTDATPDVVPHLRELSRLKYGRPRNIVVQEIIERSKIGQLGKPVIPERRSIAKI
ncbi:MAG: type IV secretory system conjugative DNA transfer family protein, partial [Candidatus Buchananbacteria bacterium]|nr:type IV secretory system conjugative DNA transfer family protein [Candidatus Buchananbacteria bacterium]